MPLKKTIRCSVCDTIYFENSDGCPKCMGRMGTVRALDEMVLDLKPKSIKVPQKATPKRRNPSQPSLVVGWLVALAGSDRGKSFRLTNSKNTIGSGDGCSVLLTEEALDETPVAAVLFDDTDQSFYLINGMGKNLVRVNGALLRDSVVLKEGSTVTIEKTQLILVPLCSERFNWGN
jgi:hypothetical protein